MSVPVLTQSLKSELPHRLKHTGRGAQFIFFQEEGSSPRPSSNRITWTLHFCVNTRIYRCVPSCLANDFIRACGIRAKTKHYWPHCNQGCVTVALLPNLLLLGAATPGGSAYPKMNWGSLGPFSPCPNAHGETSPFSSFPNYLFSGVLTPAVSPVFWGCRSRALH